MKTSYLSSRSKLKRDNDDSAKKKRQSAVTTLALFIESEDKTKLT